MRSLAYVIVLLLSGCATHRDFLSTFRVTGTIDTNSATSPVSEVEVILVDLLMDDSRPESARQISRSLLAANERFTIVSSYHWGSSRSDPHGSAILGLRVVAVGCSPVERRVRIAQLPREQRQVLVELGMTPLQCK